MIDILDELQDVNGYVKVLLRSGDELYGVPDCVEFDDNEENKGKVIVALLPDSGDRYYSTPLFTE